jgi:hypothetical protein
MSDTYVIVNLPDAYEMQIHAAGCGHLSRIPVHKQWPMSRAEIGSTDYQLALEAWEDFIPEEMTEDEAVQYTRIMKCTGRPGSR